MADKITKSNHTLILACIYRLDRWTRIRDSNKKIKNGGIHGGIQFSKLIGIAYNFIFNRISN